VQEHSPQDTRCPVAEVPQIHLPEYPMTSGGSTRPLFLHVHTSTGTMVMNIAIYSRNVADIFFLLVEKQQLQAMLKGWRYLSSKLGTKNPQNFLSGIRPPSQDFFSYHMRTSQSSFL